MPQSASLAPLDDAPLGEGEDRAPDSRSLDLLSLASSMPPPLVVSSRPVDGALLNLSNGFGNEQLTRPAKGQWKRTAKLALAIVASLAIGYVAGAASPRDASAAPSRLVSAAAMLETLPSPIVTPSAEALEAKTPEIEAAPEAVDVPRTPEASEPAARPAKSAPVTSNAASPAPKAVAVQEPESPGSNAIQAEESSIEEPSAPPFNRESAAGSLSSAASSAAGCGAAEGIQGEAQVRVVFSPSGRATSTTLVGGQLLGTKAGSCVAVAMRRASVPAFSGEPVAVTRTIYIR